MKIKRTRRAFIIEYTCVLILLLLLLFSSSGDISLPNWLNFLSISMAILILVSIEVVRLNHRAVITNSKVLIIDGLLKQTKKHIWIYAITDIEMHQNYVQRLLGYGNIHLRSASGQQALHLKNINSPEQIMEKLEELIEKYKNKQT